MIRIRPAAERGHFDHGWLRTWHSFSFGEYRDPQHMGFRNLRVINEDYVAPARGFGTHPHRDMEIVTWMLAGSLEHQDSMGNRFVLEPGDVQRMSAGTGILHSERNPSSEVEAHLLQIWILPERPGIEPSWEQRRFDDGGPGLTLLAAPGGPDDALDIHQDARILAGRLGAGETLKHSVPEGRHAWLQLAEGELDVNGHALMPGDGLASDESLNVAARGAARFLVFDLA